MQLDLNLIIAIVGLLSAVVLLFLYLKQKDISKEQFFQNEEFRIYIEKILEEKNELKLQHAILNTRYESEIQSSAEKLNAMQNAKDELSKEFKILANQIFEDKSKQFNHVHKEQFEMLLKPFREQISNFSTDKFAN